MKKIFSKLLFLIIASTTASVVWPQEIKKEDIKGICYTGMISSKKSLCSVIPSLNDRTKMVIKSNGSLGSGEGLSFIVSLPKNILAVLEPKEIADFPAGLAGDFLVVGVEVGEEEAGKKFILAVSL